jgi:hypothetical protein
VFSLRRRLIFFISTARDNRAALAGRHRFANAIAANTITTTGAQLREGSTVSCGRWRDEQKRRQYLDRPRDDGGKWIGLSGPQR